MMSLRVRFVLVTAVMVAGILIAVGIVVNSTFESRLNAGLRGQLDDAVSSIQAQLNGAPPTATALSAGSVGRTLPRGSLLVVHDSGGARTVPGGKAINAIPQSVWDGAGAQAQYVSADIGGAAYDAEVLGASTSGRGINAWAVAVPSGSVDDALHDLRITYIPIAVAAVLLASAAAWFVARGALRPVSRLRDAVETVGTDAHLERRVTVPHSGDEVEQLASAFNRSLDRIQTAHHRLEQIIVAQRRFVHDAAHELRTPLTTVSSTLQLLDAHTAMDESMRNEVVRGALFESHQMALLIDDLLLLADLDEGGAVKKESFDWNSLLDDVVAEARTSLQPRRVSADVQPGLGRGNGDPQLLRRALAAVVDNVRAFTPSDVAVAITARIEGNAVTVGICDSGAGVPAEMLDRIFDRFVRLDDSHTGHATGLGLSIARAVVLAHGGQMAARGNTPQGLCVEMRLPR